MKNIVKLIVVSLYFMLTMANCPNVQAASDLRYATVDVQKVVASSKQVNALRNEQNAKMRELSEFVQKANKQLSETADQNKKAELEKKLNAELNAKKTKMDKTYAEKLEAIDKNISNVIATVAKQKGYNLVLAKGVVLYGSGTDITNDVIQVVK